jgi:Ger(x)C family germination protein
MKKTILTLIFAALAALAFNKEPLTPNHTDLTATDPVTAMGLDASDDPRPPYETTIFIKKEQAEKAGETGDSEKAADAGEKKSDERVKTAAGKSFSEALEKMMRVNFRTLSAGNVQRFFIGEAAARGGIEKYADYVARARDMRLTANLYIVREESAKALLEASAGTFEPTKAKPIGNNSGLSARTYALTFIEFLKQASAEVPSVAVPTAFVQDADGEKEILIEGYALLKNYVLVDALSGDEARGANLLMNKPVQSVLNLEFPNEGTLALNVENAKSKYEYVFENEKLAKIKVNAQVETTMFELDRGVLNAREDKTLREIETRADALLKAETARVLEAAKRNRCDFLGVYKDLKLRRPYYWNQIKDDWEETFARTPFEINVSTALKRPYAFIQLKEKGGGA